MAKEQEKNFNTKPYDAFESLAKKLGPLTDAKLGESIGYSTGAVSGWKRNGEVPAVAMLALECLVRRQGASAQRSQVIILKVDSKEDLAWLELTIERAKGVAIVSKVDCGL